MPQPRPCPAEARGVRSCPLPCPALPGGLAGRCSLPPAALHRRTAAAGSRGCRERRPAGSPQSLPAVCPLYSCNKDADFARRGVPACPAAEPGAGPRRARLRPERGLAMEPLRSAAASRPAAPSAPRSPADRPRSGETPPRREPAPGRGAPRQPPPPRPGRAPLRSRLRGPGPPRPPRYLARGPGELSVTRRRRSAALAPAAGPWRRRCPPGARAGGRRRGGGSLFWHAGRRTARARRRRRPGQRGGPGLCRGAGSAPAPGFAQDPNPRAGQGDAARRAEPRDGLRCEPSAPDRGRQASPAPPRIFLPSSRSCPPYTAAGSRSFFPLSHHRLQQTQRHGESLVKNTSQGMYSLL